MLPAANRLVRSLFPGTNALALLSGQMRFVIDGGATPASAFRSILVQDSAIGTSDLHRVPFLSLTGAAPAASPCEGHQPCPLPGTAPNRPGANWMPPGVRKLSSRFHFSPADGKTVCCGSGIGASPFASRQRMAFSLSVSAASAWEKSSLAESSAPGVSLVLAR